MVSSYFFLEKTDDLFSHRPLESDDLFSCRLITTPILARRLSSALSKFSHIKIILFGCHPLDGVTQGGSPRSLTPLQQSVGIYQHFGHIFTVHTLKLLASFGSKY